MAVVATVLKTQSDIFELSVFITIELRTTTANSRFAASLLRVGFAAK